MWIYELYLLGIYICVYKHLSAKSTLIEPLLMIMFLEVTCILISRILIFNMLILRFHQSVCVSIQLLPVLLCLLHFGVFIDIIVIHHWCMLMNRFLREFYLQLVKCWWDLNSVITFLWLKFDVLESLLVYNYWLMLFASFFIVYVYDVTDVTQRALLEYLSTNVPVCESN